MAHYLLYFPRADEPNEQRLFRAGLARLLNTGKPLFWHAILQHGPDDGNGLIAYWATGETTVDPNEHQTFKWQPGKANVGEGLEEGWYWFGTDPKNSITPDDLTLPRRFTGYDVTCADGQQWHIPAAMKLPHAHGLNMAGVWERKVAPEYEEFAARSSRYATEIWTKLDEVELEEVATSKDNVQHVVSVSLHDADSHCCDALALNYRVCPEIVDLLGLLSDEVMIAIISMTIDLPAIVDILKQKKTGCHVDIPVGLNTDYGGKG